MKIGARTLKSGIAIFISLMIPNLLGIPEATVLAGISSVSVIQQSVKRSYDQFLNRITANMLGGLLAVASSYYFGTDFFVIAVTAIILIALLHQFGLDNSIALAAVTLIVIMLNDTDRIVISAIIRVIGTMIGVTCSFLVNRFILPPRYDEVLYKKMVLQTDEIAKLLRSALRKNSQHAKVNHDLDALSENERQMDQLFQHIQDEAVFGSSSKRWLLSSSGDSKFARARMLVIYRQFLRTNKAGVNLINAFHHSEHLFNNFPTELRISIRERLETLITAHEQIILKFSGRIQADNVNFHEYKQELRVKFIDSFLALANSEEYMQGDQYDNSNAVIYLMGRTFKYEEEVQHLNVLVRSYRTFHQETIREIGDEVNLD